MKTIVAGWIAVLTVLGSLATALHSQVEVPATSPPAADQDPLKKQAFISANQESLVIVEYLLQYDKGEPPAATGFAERCPSCGRYHVGGDLETYMSLERPVERPGILIDGTRVVTADVQIHPRFVRGIKVRRYTPDGRGEPSVDAQIWAYPRQENAVLLQLAGPIAGARPAVFEPRNAGPYSVVTVTPAEGEWRTGVLAMGGELFISGGKPVISAPAGLAVDRDGKPVGVATGIEMPADGAWRANPTRWPAISAADMGQLIGKVEAQSARGLVRVTLNFRSPKNSPGSSSYYRPYTMGDDPEATIQHALGVVTDPHTVLVLSELQPTVTARLERVRIASDPPVEARFKATLKDFGAFLVQTDTPLTGAPALSTADIRSLRGVALPSAEVRLHGEDRLAFFQHRRIAGFNVGWRNNIYPELAGNEENVFFYDAEAKLLVVPVSQRPRASAEDRYSVPRAVLTPVSLIAEALAALPESADPHNIPLSEDEENRLAWIGMDLQALTPELARVNKVADQTRDGASGGIVTYVFPDSPAARAEVQQGWILLRVEVDGEPRPLEVQLETDRYGTSSFPWERLSELDEEYFDRVPTPWPSAETPLLRKLTDLGFGRKFNAVFFHDGRLESKEFTIAQGPSTFESAPKYKFEPLGLTVKDLTYEVRRYMQLKEEDPGVIIGKIELGSRASVAGLKPFELVTHLNDQPVRSIEDFQRLARDQAELRMSIKRMTAGRIVRITLTSPPAGTSPAGTPPLPPTEGRAPPVPRN